MDGAIKNKITNEKYEFISFNGSQWIKIFYHSYVNSESFENETEALSLNTSTKFSIIGEATKFKRYNGKYEFILYYPQYPTKYNQWKQSLFPLYDLDSLTRTSALGFSPVQLSWSEDFGGLVKNTEETEIKGVTSSLLDGQVGIIDWYYCIAKYKKNDSWMNLKIPGPKVEVDEVYLFMKVFDYNKMLLHTCVKVFHLSRSSLYSFLCLILLFSQTSQY